MSKPSCFVVGADSLLLECGESLLRSEWDIRGVVAGSSRVADWAKRKGLRVLDADSAWGLELAKTSFDYLFAITHLQLIADDVLRLPRRAAINFHDGPLPRYAGLNTPVWALLRGEPHYGVTWHIITPGIDEGDILKQRLFDVAADETSLSINTRNFDAAMESFSELLVELEAGQEVRTPQAASAERRVYSRHDRPPALCAIDVNDTAQAAERLVRALDFGRYPNPVGSAKLVVNDRCVVVTAAEAREGDEGEIGEVLLVDDQELLIRMAEGGLALKRFATVEGRPLTAREAADLLNIAQGERVPALAAAEAWTALGQVIAKAERHFQKQLSTLEPVELPWAQTPKAAHTPVAAVCDVVVPEAFARRFADRRSDAMRAAFVCVLARLSGKSRFHVALGSAATVLQVASAAPLVAARIPFEVKLDDAHTFERVLGDVAKALQQSQTRATFLNDLWARTPDARPLQAGHAIVPIGIADNDASQKFDGLVLDLRTDHAGASFHFDEALVARGDVEALSAQLTAVMAAVAESPTTPTTPVATVDLLGAELRRQVLENFNDTKRDYRRDACVHHLVEEQVDRTPEQVAVIFEDESLTYAQLESRANQLAHHLRALGVGPDRLVGVFVERSLDLIVAVQAVHKAGGAYVPLDPAYPRERVAHMIEDSGCAVIITQQRLVGELPSSSAQVVQIDADWDAHVRALPTSRVRAATAPHHLAYCIYTSGSTGKPKGVLVEHRNVVNFFAGMDERIARDSGTAPPTWFAVTSLSFDISVLELFYTLARGYRVVVYLDRDKRPGEALAHANKPLDFSLFYFSGDEAEHTGPGKYRLLLEGAKYADEHGFVAVWTPERHFHAFGGLYPNPAITGAAVAAVTKRVQIRAGSVVLPLHHPIRVAEGWSVVDNLSNGRVAIAFASGWAPTDFVLMPQNYKHAKQVMLDNIDVVRRLWRGEKVSFPGALGDTVEVGTLPRPVQQELPTWITTAGNPETYEQAGRAGANVLTHLLGQSVEQLAPKIAAYRRARQEAGFDPETGIVSLMLHTYVGADENAAREMVRGPLKQYLGTSLSLLKQYAWAFPAFQKPAGTDVGGGDEFAGLTAEEQDAVLEFAFLRYYETSGLFGTPDQCVAFADQLKGVGVDEIACLVDFGVATDVVLESLPLLDEVRRRSNAFARQKTSQTDQSAAAQLSRHGVTHMQCTPSMARMLSMHEDASAALARVQHLMIGGEAFPLALGKDLVSLPGTRTVTNMYGPTETTIWSTTWPLQGEVNEIPIGTPIANTQVYILDKNLQPLPPGVPGELWLGGDGVVRGYHQRAELTAERFVHDPFRGGDARMYRTGDLAKWRVSGDGRGIVDFLGRIDHQVKIRGYRIELGEIEAQLSQQHHVRECVVVVREETPGDQQLVAFCSPAYGQTLDAERLKDGMRVRLPEFMVPAHVVVLEELPHTPNGKLDRKALPQLSAVLARRRDDDVLVAAESDVEKNVLAVWQETLGKESISVDDNFFDIGGHSLLVVRMHRRLKEVIERPVSLTDLYRFPTIRTFAEFISSDGQSEAMKKSADRAAKRKENLQRRRGGRA